MLTSIPLRLFLAISLCVLLLVPSSAVRGQSIPIRELQVIPVEAKTRPIAQIDAVESALVRGAPLPAPTRSLLAADDNWFRDDDLTGNYLRATVTIDADGVWLLEAMAYTGVYVNGTLRMGNVYGYKDDWESWEPQFNFGFLPVPLHAGENELLFFGVRWGIMRAQLTRADKLLSFNVHDTTLPDLVVGQAADTWGELPILNTSGDLVRDAQLEVRCAGEAPVVVEVPPLPPYGVRKVGFPIRCAARPEAGSVDVEITVRRGSAVLDRAVVPLRVKLPMENRRVTFFSRIDDSVQYFGFLPASRDDAQALVLSLHGAGVEAINQSGSYAPLSWAHLVAPTNRRPYGFDWENWGRLDALEVLDQNLTALSIAPDRVYLTGHSMGGHGSWHLSTLYPDRFAAVGPSAGWITYWSYRREPPQDAPSPLKTMLARASLTSQVPERATNLAPLGVYVLHGAEDDNVPPAQSHLMLERLKTFHHDFVYHEQPGVGHWWDLSDAPGADCVAWQPMFDFFAQHRLPRDDEVRAIQFVTPSPGVSSWDHWVCIARQQRVFEMSRADVTLDPWQARVVGTTANVELLGLEASQCNGDSLHVTLDGETLHVAVPEDGVVWLERGTHWSQVAGIDPAMKSPQRNGGFRDAYGNRVQLVVGTRGTPEQTAWAWARARFDAEYLWYQGNASLDVLPDTEFDPDAEPDRNVVLYGNADTHASWSRLVNDALRVGNGGITVGEHTLRGDAFGVLAIRPRPGSDRASVGIVSGTGLPGLRLTERRPALQGGFAYPDLTVLEDRGDGTVVRGAGFFGNDWSVSSGDFVWLGDH